MPKSNDIYKGRPPTQHEINKVLKHHNRGLYRGFYREMVNKFYKSKKRLWAYPVPEGVNGGSYLNGFRHAIISLGYTGKMSAHGCKSDIGDAIILRRDE